MASPQEAPLEDLLSKVRSMLRTSPPFIPADARPLLDQALALLSREDMDDLEVQRRTSDLAHTVSSVIEDTQDNATVAYGFGLLLELGPVGEHLAGCFLYKNKVRPESLSAFLSSYEAHQQLLLIDQFFRTPREVEPWFLKWAFDLIKEYQSEDPEETLLYLEALDERGQTPALPLQQELMRGRFGIWLGQLLQMDLDEEQVLYMARTAGRLGSPALAEGLLKRAGELQADALCAVLEAVGRTGERGDQKLVRDLAMLLKQPNPRVKLAALDCLLTLGARQGVSAKVFLHQKLPALRPELYRRLPLLGARDFAAFMKAIPATDHAEALLHMAALVHRAAPEWTDHGVKALKRMSPKKIGEYVITTFMEYVDQYPPVPRRPYYEPPPFTGAVGKGAVAESGGGGVFSQVRKAMGKGDDAGSRHALQSLSPGDAVDSKTYQNGALQGCRFERNIFSKVAFVNLDLSASAVSNVQFRDCKLKNVEFSGSRFTSVSFTNCTLENCRFSDSLLDRVRFDRCLLQAAHFCGVQSELVGSRDSRFYENDFWGASFKNWEVERVRFKNVNFSHCQFRGLRCHGSVFEDCRFEKAFIIASAVTNSRIIGRLTRLCRVFSLESDTPELLRAEAACLDDRLEAAAEQFKRRPVPAELGAAEGVKFLYQFAQLWCTEREAAARRRAFLERNADRLDWAVCKTDDKGAAFIRMLPALIESKVAPGVSRGEHYVFPVTPCVISGYAPDCDTVTLLREQLGEDHVDIDSKRDGLPVEAVYTIGSTGTIAQTRSSDIDVWVCYEARRIAEDKLKELQDKLTALEEWADALFDLEVHFFLMDLDRIRANDFGFSGDESAGSAQAKLLKEEFYRTAVLLAGKTPAWHCMPPGVSEKGYEKQLRAISRSPLVLSARAADLVDLGPLADIPREEYFGASLWQIVKGLKSPFKSVMKLGLMDRHVNDPEHSELLCDRIKEALFLGHGELWKVDPYAVLFLEVFTHYERAERMEERDLMQMAFVQKTGYNPLTRTSGRRSEISGDSYIEYFFPHSESDMENRLTPMAAGAGFAAAGHKREEAGFAELVALGDRVSRFMFTTYAGMQKKLSGQSTIAITADDMTKLGRKIISSFSEAEGKIKRLSLLRPASTIFSSLQFSCEGVQGAPMTWIAEGEPARRRGKSGKAVEEAGRDKNPVRLLTWLAVNGLYQPSMPLKGSSTLQSPVSLPDVTDLLQALFEFFPADMVFDTEIDQNLKPERVNRVFIVVNFTAPRDMKKPTQAMLVYATNWGELFCREVNKPFEVLELSARDFASLALEGLGKTMARHAKVELFTPEKSMCHVARV